ncbi:MAG: hypothetical protein AAFR92_04275 [Pseudomonadota bacterium]
MATAYFETKFKSAKLAGTLIFCLSFAVILFLLGIVPAMMEGVNIFETDTFVLEQIENFGFPLIVWPIAFGLTVSSLSYFGLYRTKSSVVEFRSNGVFGHNGLGQKRSLRWGDIVDVQLQDGIGNIIIFGSTEHQRPLTRLISFGFEYWNPDAIIIPASLTSAEPKEVLRAFFDMNPYSDRNFPDWRSKV